MTTDFIDASFKLRDELKNQIRAESAREKLAEFFGPRDKASITPKNNNNTNRRTTTSPLFDAVAINSHSSAPTAPTATTTAAPDDMDWQNDMIMAFHLYTQSRSRVPRTNRTLAAPIDPNNVPVHACSSACDFFQYKKIYICETSGDMHVCVEGLCPSRSVGLSHVTCTTTCNVFGLDFQWDLNDRAGTGDCYGGPDRLVFSKKRKEREWDAHQEAMTEQKADPFNANYHSQQGSSNAKRKQSKVSQSSALQSTTTVNASMSSKASGGSHQRKARLKSLKFQGDQTAKDRCTMNNMMNTLTLLVPQLAKETEWRADMIWHVNHLWNLIKKTAYVRDNPQSYPLQYHFWVVLYHSRVGMNASTSVTVIPHSEVSFAHLPTERNVKMLGFQHSRKTQADKRFRRCIGELVAMGEFALSKEKPF